MESAFLPPDASPLFRAVAEICRPINVPPPAQTSGALSAGSLAARASDEARKLMDEFPGASLRTLMVTAFLRGYTVGFEAMADEAKRIIDGPVRAPSRTEYDNSATCQRCGTKHMLVSGTPLSGEALNNYVCPRCAGWESA